VFVSIVSTKIPFKGAGKEYVGDDVEEMVTAVKAAIQACGVQLKARGRGGRAGRFSPG
jgi:DNA topoisomerase VI subunit B